MKGPENTLFVFGNALSSGAQVLEMDIRLSADGGLVVIHDELVDRTTDGTGRVCDLTLSEIMSLDAGYRWTPDKGREHPFRNRGLRIPALSSVFEAFPETTMNIDIKSEEPSLIPLFVKLIRKHEMTDRVLVASFNDAQLKRFRKACPEVPTAAGVSEIRRFLIMERTGLGRLFFSRARAFQIPEAHQEIRILRPSFLRLLQKKNIPVHVWTINSEADMRRLIRMGVDGIFTDDPFLLMEIIRDEIYFSHHAHRSPHHIFDT